MENIDAQQHLILAVTPGGLSRDMTTQKRLVYMLNGQHVPNLLACHKRVAAHQRGLSKEVILFMYAKTKIQKIKILTVEINIIKH